MAQLGIKKTQMQEVQFRIILIYFALAYWGENEQSKERQSKEESVLDFLLLLGNKIVFYFSFQEDMFESVWHKPMFLRFLYVCISFVHVVALFV